MNNPKPCPFCGNKKVSVVRKFYEDYEDGVFVSGHEGYVEVWCFDCDFYRRSPTLERVIEEWNAKRGIVNE